MKIGISDEVIKRTTKCHSNFACLNDEEYPKCSDGLAVCEIENHIAQNLLFVNFENNCSCNYSTPFGAGKIICKCPVRYEIYQRYSI